MREVEDSAEQGVVRGRLPVAWIGVQPYVKSLDQSLSVLLTCQGTGSLIEGIVPRQQQLQHFPRRGERPIRRQEDIDIRRLEFPVVVRQTFHQPLHRAGFQETHPHRLPFQMRDLVVRVLIESSRNWRKKLVEELMNGSSWENLKNFKIKSSRNWRKESGRTYGNGSSWENLKNFKISK